MPEHQGSVPESSISRKPEIRLNPECSVSHRSIRRNPLKLKPEPPCRESEHVSATSCTLTDSDLINIYLFIHSVLISYR